MDYYPFAKAGPLGHFLKTIRVADLNMVTAEWVGWGSRTGVTQATRMKTILAGTDPVALDYYGAKHLVYPLSRRAEHHDPDNPRSAVARFLHLTQESWGQGVLDEARMRIQEHSFTDG